jgi:HSP20 family protein
MSGAQEISLREKKELAGSQEKTVPGRYYVPETDIFETDEALTVVVEMPGVSKTNVDVSLENDVLSVEGRIELSKYAGMEPVYTEYAVGNFARRFTISGKIDRDRIAADVADGVLTLTLPKVKEAQPRRIPIG